MNVQAAFLRAIVSSVLLFSPLLSSAQQNDAGLSSQPARRSPDWLKSGIIYQAFVRSFSPEGTLSGVDKHLDELHDLGVNIVWLMPIHPNGQIKKKGTLGSPYSVRDYYAIDPALGTKEDLHRLVQDAHRRDMKVIIDMVANHTSWDSVMMAHPEFYKKDKQGNITYPYDWSDVAALDYSNPKLRRYMTDMLVHWIKDFDLDGYRCDAASEVPTSFWEAARTELDRVKPDIMMLAEASKPELLRSAFDMDYSWPLFHSIDDVVINGASAETLKRTLEEQAALFPKGALHMRISDDHDELRATTRYGYAGNLAASAFVLTMNGTPLIYNGMEVGDSTQSRGSALFEPQKIFWSAAEWHPDYRKFYATVAALRRQHPALQQGELVWLHNSDEQHVVSYLRRANQDEFVVAINLSNTPFRGTVEAATAAWKEIALPGEETRSNSLPVISLGAFETRIFQRPAP